MKTNYILKVEIERHIFRMLYYAWDAAKDANATVFFGANGHGMFTIEKKQWKISAAECKNTSVLMAAKYTVMFSVVHQIFVGEMFSFQ